MLPAVSLNAATAAGVGTAKDLEAVLGNHQLIATLVTSGATNADVDVEISHDGVRWVRLGGISFSASSAETRTTGPLSGLARFVRANLVSLSGGASPTVTATVASV